jgi:hypothetical protein
MGALRDWGWLIVPFKGIGVKVFWGLVVGVFLS